MKLPMPFKDDEDLDALDDDDSFLNPPTISKKIGKNIIENFEKRRSRNAAPPHRLLRNTSNNTATVFNNQITFLAVRGTARATHDWDKYGTKPCGLHPYCSNVLKGGEDIGLLYIVSPAFHPSYEDNCWCCWYHAEASIDGIEVQTQKKVPVASTPKNVRSARTSSKLTNAPIKKSTKVNTKADGGDPASTAEADDEDDGK